MRNLSIKRKLTLIIMGASTVALLIVAFGFVAYELIAFQRITRQDLSTLGEIVGAQSTAALTYEDEKVGKEILSALVAKKHIVSACLYRSDDKVLATYNRAGQSDSEPFPAHPGPEACRFEKDYVVLIKPVHFDGRTIGTIYLKSDLEERSARLWLCAGLVALLVLVSWAITYFLSSRLQRIVSGPIFHLAQTAKAVTSAENYSLRAEKHAQDELGELVDGFNAMLSQIQQRDGALQQANDELEKRVRERTRDLELEIAERKRAEGALQEQFGRTNLLNQITEVISERQDLESILYVVLRQLEDHLGVEAGLVCLFDRAAETLSIAAVRLKNHLLAPKLDLREGVVVRLDDSGLRACRHGDLLNFADTRKVQGALVERYADAGFRSAVAIPLTVENRLFGVLFAGRLKPEGFEALDCDFLRTLSKHVALAAHQAQLHAELETAYNELRQTQQTVMQQERLKALGQMASGIAHDVNNALSPVVGFADLLIRSEPHLTPNGKKYLQYIKTAGEDIAHIVARLREFYRRRDEGEKLAALNLNDLARQVIDMTRPRWRDIPQGRGIMVEMRTDLDPALPDLAGIESEIREAVTNLILNAVDALPTGGSITVRTRTNHRDASAANGCGPDFVMLEVSDSGIGMDEEARKHCMEPFFSTKGKRGTGMGLAMVFGVMERHEGKVDIQSERGKGTTVTLFFPIRELEHANGVEREQKESLAPLHVLCIDDEPLIRELLKEMLEHDGHIVRVADGGQAGVEEFRAAGSRARPFDIVITDLGMPYCDGRQVAAVLKRESPKTPIVMLTGWGAFMKEDGDVPAQVDGVLSKPPRSAEIRETIRRLVYCGNADAKSKARLAAHALLPNAN